MTGFPIPLSLSYSFNEWNPYSFIDLKPEKKLCVVIDVYLHLPSTVPYFYKKWVISRYNRFSLFLSAHFPVWEILKFILPFAVNLTLNLSIIEQRQSPKQAELGKVNYSQQTATNMAIRSLSRHLHGVTFWCQGHSKVSLWFLSLVTIERTERKKGHIARGYII